MAERRVGVTGVGAVSPAGPGHERFWEALVAARQGARAVETFSTKEFRSHAAAIVQGFDPKKYIAPAKVRRLDTASRYAVAAARQALEHGHYSLPPSDPDRIGSIFGSSSAGSSPVREFLEPVIRDGPQAALPMVFPNTVGNAPSSYVAIEIGLRGPNVTVSQREASGVLAMSTAWGFVREGRADAMIAGGADEVPESFFRAFDRIGVLQRSGECAEGSYPYASVGHGFVMGEGAYALLLEPIEEPRAVGGDRRILCEVRGFGMSGDTVTLGRWPRDENAVTHAMEEALEEARVLPREIDLVVASANGVAELEMTEARALGSLFRGGSPAVTSVKRVTGEMGGSGAASALAAALAIERQMVFPVLSAERTRPGLLFEPLREPQSAVIRHVLVSAIGSGGACAAMILSKVAE